MISAEEAEKGDKFTSKQHQEVREVPDCSRANGSARPFTNSFPHVAKAIAWILQDAIAIYLWKRLDAAEPWNDRCLCN
jgi:hypothetical protein